MDSTPYVSLINLDLMAPTKREQLVLKRHSPVVHFLVLNVFPMPQGDALGIVKQPRAGRS
jgi:hypothetical protein